MDTNQLVKWIRDHVSIRRVQIVHSRAMLSINGEEFAIVAGSLSALPEDLELDTYEFEQYPVKDLLPALVCDCGETIEDGDAISKLLAHIEEHHPELEE